MVEHLRLYVVQGLGWPMPLLVRMSEEEVVATIGIGSVVGVHMWALPVVPDLPPPSDALKD